MATTRGFVQQLTLLGGPITCAWVGNHPTASELFTVAVASGDSAAVRAHKLSMTATLVEAAASGRSVSVGHADDSAAVTSVAYPLDSTSSTPVQMDGIELTQAVQDVSQCVPLIAGKRTVARVYLSNYGASSMTVLGQLQLRKAPTDPPVVVDSTASVVLNPADAGDLAVTRNSTSRSLNFVIPQTMASEGPLNVTLSALTDAVTGASVTVGSERRPTVFFHRAAPLRVRIYGVRYTQGSPAVTFVPSDFDFEMLLSWLERAYPGSQVHSSRVLITADATPPFSCGDVNAQIAALRALDMDAGGDQRTHYYALVSDGGFFMRGCAGVPVMSPNPGAVGSGPTGSGTWGWDFDGSYGDWYGGHELGHTFGRRHPGFCGESNDDNDYPYPAGQVGGDPVSFMGFDVGDPALGLPMAALPGTQWKDVMTYCDFQWLSAYTYLGIKRRLLEEDNLGSTASPGPGPGPGAGQPVGSAPGGGGRPDQRFRRAEPAAEPAAGPVADAGDTVVSVVATVNLTRGRGEIRYVNPVPSSTPSPQVEAPRARVRAIGENGETLAELPVEVRLNSERDPGEDERGLVDAVVAVPAGTAALELVLGDSVADTFQAAGAPPEARGLTATPEDAGPGLRLRSQASEQAAAGQSYYAQISTDGGRTWATIAVGLSEPEVVVDQSQFAPGQEVLVKVVATNGLTRTTVATESFRA